MLGHRSSAREHPLSLFASALKTATGIVGDSGATHPVREVYTKLILMERVKKVFSLHGGKEQLVGAMLGNPGCRRWRRLDSMPA
jgi:hypothetical protein